MKGSLLTSDRARACYVYLQMPGSLEVVTCGRYQRETLPTGETLGRFVYGQRYLARPDAVELDPFQLPLGESEVALVTREALPGVLADAGPDAWGRNVIRRLGARPDPDVLDFLLESPQDRAGALSFGHGVVPPAPVRDFNRVLQLQELRDAAGAMEAPEGAPVPKGARILLQPTTSLMGGARPKAVIEDDGDLWLAKFPARRDRWNNAPVEAAMLRLAGHCGITVPAARVERLGEEQVLLVRRFDRTATPEGYLRHRMASGLTVVGGEEFTTDREAWSYLRLADEIQRWVGVGAQGHREQLYRRMAFNACISNTDDHPKNHALLAPGRGWQLSPAYDLTPAPQVGLERDLAMECGPEGRAARRSNLLGAAPRFGLTVEEADRIIQGIVACVQGRWASEVRAAGGTEADCAVIANAFVPAGFHFVAS